MKTKSKRYLYHHDYIFLVSGLGAGVIAYFAIAAFPFFQASVVVMMGLFYVLWGTIHHARQGDFHLKIILEYTLIALVAMMMLLSQILRK